jgi:hypothetical protein
MFLSKILLHFHFIKTLLRFHFLNGERTDFALDASECLKQIHVLVNVEKIK